MGWRFCQAYLLIQYLGKNMLFSRGIALVNSSFLVTCSHSHDMYHLIIITRGAVWSGSSLFAIPSAPFGYISHRSYHVQILGELRKRLIVSKDLGKLRYMLHISYCLYLESMLGSYDIIILQYLVHLFVISRAWKPMLMPSLVWQPQSDMGGHPYGFSYIKRAWCYKMLYFK